MGSSAFGPTIETISAFARCLALSGHTLRASPSGQDLAEHEKDLTAPEQESQRVDQPPLCVVVLPGAGDQIVVSNQCFSFISIDVSTIAFLLDGVGIVAQGCEHPSLRIVVLR
jgi:hypothetical protein